MHRLEAMRILNRTESACPNPPKPATFTIHDEWIPVRISKKDANLGVTQGCQMAPLNIQSQGCHLGVSPDTRRYCTKYNRSFLSEDLEKRSSALASGTRHRIRLARSCLSLLGPELASISPPPPRPPDDVHLRVAWYAEMLTTNGYSPSEVIEHLLAAPFFLELSEDEILTIADNVAATLRLNMKEVTEAQKPLSQAAAEWVAVGGTVRVGNRLLVVGGHAVRPDGKIQGYLFRPQPRLRAA